MAVCGDKLVTFLKLKAYTACLDVKENNKVVTIQPYRSTSVKHLRDAICHGMGTQSIQQPFSIDAMESFKALFPSGMLSPTDAVTFQADNKGLLCLSKNSETMSCVADKGLATAFMNMYFNLDHSVMPELTTTWQSCNKS